MLIASDRLCYEYEVDTISTGVTIAFAMELYERGILKLSETDGIKLNFGNHQNAIKIIQLMAYRIGIGKIFADGTREAAKRIGHSSEKYALHVKGLELPAYDVRGAKAHGLNYATSYTGVDHNRGYAFQEIFFYTCPLPC